MRPLNLWKASYLCPLVLQLPTNLSTAPSSLLNIVRDTSFQFSVHSKSTNSVLVGRQWVLFLPLCSSNATRLAKSNQLTRRNNDAAFRHMIDTVVFFIWTQRPHLVVCIISSFGSQFLSYPDSCVSVSSVRWVSMSFRDGSHDRVCQTDSTVAKAVTKPINIILNKELVFSFAGIE